MTIISNIIINNQVEVQLDKDGKLYLVKHDRRRKHLGFKEFLNKLEAEKFLMDQFSKMKKVTYYQYTTLTDINNQVEIEVHQVGIA